MEEENELLTVDEFAEGYKKKYPQLRDRDNHDLTKMLIDKRPELKELVDFNNDLLSIDEFAQGFKEKYPQFQDEDNYSLTERLIDKYPKFQDKVDFQKKNPNDPTESISEDASMDITEEIGTGEESSEVIEESQGNSITNSYLRGSTLGIVNTPQKVSEEDAKLPYEQAAAKRSRTGDTGYPRYSAKDLGTTFADAFYNAATNQIPAQLKTTWELNPKTLAVEDYTTAINKAEAEGLDYAEIEETKISSGLGGAPAQPSTRKTVKVPLDEAKKRLEGYRKGAMEDLVDIAMDRADASKFVNPNSKLSDGINPKEFMALVGGQLPVLGASMIPVLGSGSMIYGDIYMENLTAIAAQKNKVEEQDVTPSMMMDVISKGEDEKAIALTGAAIATSLDVIGLGKAFNIIKGPATGLIREAVKKGIAKGGRAGAIKAVKRAGNILTSGAVEYGTEALQGVTAQVSKQLALGRTAIEAFQNIDFESANEEGLAGAVMGGGMAIAHTPTFSSKEVDAMIDENDLGALKEYTEGGLINWKAIPDKTKSKLEFEEQTIGDKKYTYPSGILGKDTPKVEVDVKEDVDIDEQTTTDPTGVPSMDEGAEPNVDQADAEAGLTAEESTDQQGERISEAIDKPNVYSKDGKKGAITTDGQTVVLETRDQVIELGNIDEIADKEISELGLEKESTESISVDDDYSVTIDEDKYNNRFSDPSQSINYNEDGEVVSVNLETEKGQKRTIRGQRAEEIAYQYKQKEFENEATDEQIERADNEAREIAESESQPTETNTEAEVENTSEPIVEEVEKPPLTNDDLLEGESITEPIVEPKSTPKDKKGLFGVLKEVFGLGDKQAKASSEVSDAIVGTMAERAGITKEEMYAKIAYKKSKTAPKGSLKQESPLIFKSTAKEGLGKVQQKSATPDQWVKQISEKGGKGTSQELEWIGLQDFLDDWKKENNAKSVPKEVVEKYINDNQIEVREITKGAVASDELSSDELKRLEYLEDLDSKNPSGAIDDTEGDGTYDEFLTLLNRRDKSTPESLTRLQEETFSAARKEQQETRYSGNFRSFTEQEKGLRLNEKEISIEFHNNEGELKKEYLERKKGKTKSWEENQRAIARLEVLELSPEGQGGIANPTKYSEYTERGGENYREVLLTLPGKPLTFEEFIEDARRGGVNFTEEGSAERRYNEYLEDVGDDISRTENYKSSHWDEENILAHIRLNERTLANGERVLFVEEIQSDWAQAGKKRGFKSSKMSEGDVMGKEMKNINAEINALEKSKDEIEMPKEESNEISREIYQYDEQLKTVRSNRDYDAVKLKIKELQNKLLEPEIKKEEINKKIDGLLLKRGRIRDRKAEWDSINRTIAEPNMPYKKTDQWVGMSTRRVLQMAAQEGFDRVAWVTGEQSADRYSLSQKINSVAAIKNNDDTYNLIVEDKRGFEIEPYKAAGKKVTSSEMEEIIGKDLTKKLTEGADRNKSKEWKKSQSVNPQFFTLQGVDLEIGGEGMKSFYNSILPKVAKKEAQRFDKKAKVDVVNIENENDRSSQQLSIAITPEMRMNLNGAVPLFQGVQGAMTAADGNYVVYALSDPNVSTPLHELAHVYEHYLTDKERKDVLEWFGHKEWTTETSEKFARGFEKFLADGKTSNPKLKKAFESFKKWLTDIYNGIQGSDIDIELNDKMRGIYDAMLSEPTTKKKPTKVDKKKTADIVIDSDMKVDEKSKGKIYDFLDKKDKELSKFGKENLSFGLPIAVAQGAIKTMKLAIDTARTGADIIKAGVDYVKNTDWYKNQTKDKKAEIDTVLSNEDDFINLASEVPTKPTKTEARIERLKDTSRRLRKQFKDLKEYKKNLIDDIYKKLKLKTLDNLSNYFNEPIFKQINNAPTAGAVDRLISKIDYKIANEQLKRIDQAIGKFFKDRKKFVKKVDGKPKGNIVDNKTRKVLVDKINARLSQDLASLEKDYQDIESNLSGLSEEDFDKKLIELTAIESAINLKKAQALIDDSKALRKEKSDNPKDFTAKEKDDYSENVDLLAEGIRLKEQALNDLITLREEGKSKLKDLIRKENLRLVDIQNKGIADTQNSNADKGSSDEIRNIKDARGTFEKAWRKALSVINQNTGRIATSSFEFLSKIISNNSDIDLGFVRQYFYVLKTGFREARMNYVAERKSDDKRLNEFIAKTFKFKNNAVRFTQWFGKATDSNNKKTGIFTKDKNGNLVEQKLSKLKALSIYQWSKMPSMASNLEAAGFNEESLKQVEEFLGKDFMALGDFMTSVLEEKFPEYNKKYLELMRTEINQVDNYFPVQYINEDLNNKIDVSQDNVNLLPSITPSHTISRVKNDKALSKNVDALASFNNYLEKMTQFKHYSRATKDINSLLSNSEFKKNLTYKEESELLYKQLVQAIKFTIGGNDYSSSDVDRVGRSAYKLQRSIQITYVGFKLWTAAKQLLSFIAAYEYADSVYLNLNGKRRYIPFAGTAKFTGNLLLTLPRMFASHNFLMKNSRGYKDRIDSGDVGSEQIKQLLGGGEPSFTRLAQKQAAKIALYFNKAVDLLTIAWTGKVIYNQEYKKLRLKYSETVAREKAINQFEIYFQLSQQASDPEVLGASQRDTSWGGLLTAFKNSQISYFRKISGSVRSLINSHRNEKNRLRKAGVKDVGVKAIGKLLKTDSDRKQLKKIFIYGYAMPLAWQYVASGLPGMLSEWDDEDESQMKRTLLLGPIDGLFALTDLLKLGTSVIVDGKRWKYNPVILFEEFDNLITDYAKASDGDDIGKTILAAKYTLRFLGIIDLDVSVRMYEAIEDIVDKKGDISYENVLKVMNAPKSITGESSSSSGGSGRLMY